MGFIAIKLYRIDSFDAEGLILALIGHAVASYHDVKDKIPGDAISTRVLIHRVGLQNTYNFFQEQASLVFDYVHVLTS